ncbi:uroporphyrinogen decarboxylase family protein [Nitrospinota bacterium]
MNHWERIEAVLAGEATDRLPVSVWRHRPTLDQTADDLVAEMVEEQRRFDWDFMKVMSNRLHCVEDWGCEIQWPSTPEFEATISRYVVQRPEDWLRLEVLDPAKGALGREVEVIRRLVSELGDEVPVQATLYSPLTIAFKLADESGKMVFDHMEAHPDTLRQGLKTIAETTRRLARVYMDAGAHGVFFAIQMAGHPRFTREFYDGFCREDDMKVLEEVAGRSKFNIVHLHGAEMVDFDTFLSLPLEALNWHDQLVGPSMAAVRAKTPKVFVAGVPDHKGLVGMDNATMAEMFDRTVKECGTKGIVLGPGCTVDHWVVEEKQLHFIRAWAEEQRGSD